MDQVGEEIRELIRDRFGSIPKLAQHLGMSEQTIYSSLKTNLVGSSMTTAMPIIAALGLDPVRLTQGRIETQPPYSKSYTNVPLFGAIAAGQPAEPVEADELFPIPTEIHERHPNAFLLRVAGNSMDRILPNGCYALVDPCTCIDMPGMPYAVAVGTSDATVKRVRPLANGLELRPDSTNPTFKPLVFDFDDSTADEVRIIGRVVWYTIPFDWDFSVQ